MNYPVMKYGIILSLLLIIFACDTATSSGQNGNSSQIRQLVTGLSKTGSKVGCDGKFGVREQRRTNSAIWYEVSYRVGTTITYRQSFASDTLETMVLLEPRKSVGCGALFVEFSMGASGDYQEKYLIYFSKRKFTYKRI